MTYAHKGNINTQILPTKKLGARFTSTVVTIRGVAVSSAKKTADNRLAGKTRSIPTAHSRIYVTVCETGLAAGYLQRWGC